MCTNFPAVFRLPANTKLPFLSSVELAIALLAGRQAGRQQQPGGEAVSQVLLKQMVGLCTSTPLGSPGSPVLLLHIALSQSELEEEEL